MDYVEFCFAVLKLSVVHRFSVTSWFRSDARNKMIGGKQFSLHRLGLAVDAVLDSGEDSLKFVADAKALGLIVVVENDHIHLQAI